MGWEELGSLGGFDKLADTVEAVRELKESQEGGTLATAEEQAELETVLAQLGREEGEEEVEEEVEEEEEGGGGGASTSAAAAAAAAAVPTPMAEEVEVLSQQFGALQSPSKQEPKRHRGGDGGTTAQAIELTPSPPPAAAAVAKEEVEVIDLSGSQ